MLSLPDYLSLWLPGIHDTKVLGGEADAKS